MKKLVSFVLALVLSASLLPVQVWGGRDRYHAK